MLTLEKIEIENKEETYMKKLFAALLALSLVLTGCGAKSSSAMSNAYSPMEAAAANDSYSYELGDSDSQLPQGRKFIITENLDAEAEDLDAALAAVTEKLTALDGYIESQRVYNGSIHAGSRYRYADLTLRIPVERLEEFTAAVDSLSNVVSSSRNTEDVTLQYVDTESRVKALETERDRLLELMEQAETMSDLLEIESRLTEVRGELERYASQLKVLDNQIDYATVNLSLSEVTEYTPVTEKTRLEKIRDGFVDSVKGVWNLILDFISFVLMNIPYILLFGLILWGIIALVKRRRRKHPKKQKAEPKKEE